MHVQTRTQTCNGLNTKKAGTGTCMHVQTRKTHVHRAYTPKKGGTSTWKHVKTRTHTARGRSSRRVHTRTQGVHTEMGGCRLVDARPDAYTHVHRAYTPKRAVTCTCMHVNMRIYTCTGLTHRRGLVQGRGRKSTRVHTRAQGVHTEKGLYKHLDARPHAYTHLHGVHTPIKVGTGAWMHVKSSKHTYTRGTHRKGPVQARGCTSRRVHTRAQGVHRKWPVLPLVCTSTRVHTRAQDIHTEKGRHRHVKHIRAQGLNTKKGRHRHVEARQDAYTRVNRAYIPKGTVTCTWTHVQTSTHICTGRTRRIGPVQVRRCTS